MDYTGPGGSLTAKRGNLTQRILMMDEVRNSFAQLPRFDILEWEELLDSCDVGLTEWTRMAREISENYHKYEGFVIIHGTDTLAFTASALSFMLENLGKPVVITGAMLPMVRVESDAKQNLLLAMSVAAYSQINEVCLLFANKLLRGNRATKLDNWSITAFDSPNCRPLGKIGVEIMIDDRTTLAPPKRSFKIFTQLHTNIAVIRLCPGLDTAAVVRALVSSNAEASCSTSASTSSMMSKKVSGIVFELFGSGNAPVRGGEFLKAVKASIAANVPVVILSQCIRGSCNLDAYETGHQLQSVGVINGKDMTTEAAVTKLGYLLGKGYRGNELRNLMESSLRGEVTVRTNVLFNPTLAQQQPGGGMVSKSACDNDDENQAHCVPPLSTSNRKPIAVSASFSGGIQALLTPTPSTTAAGVNTINSNCNQHCVPSTITTVNQQQIKPIGCVTSVITTDTFNHPQHLSSSAFALNQSVINPSALLPATPTSITQVHIPPQLPIPTCVASPSPKDEIPFKASEAAAIVSHAVPTPAVMVVQSGNQHPYVISSPVHAASKSPSANHCNPPLIPPLHPSMTSTSFSSPSSPEQQDSRALIANNNANNLNPDMSTQQLQQLQLQQQPTSHSSVESASSAMSCQKETAFANGTTTSTIPLVDRNFCNNCSSAKR
eukprot:GDKJ01043684.1.p1 GENE.GDKJ01043684.1~~GDKJ01043684.1.p1  ORF type:complete len:705 (-),score=193.29 GDKJ01043684.1:422-2413(-)